MTAPDTCVKIRTGPRAWRQPFMVGVVWLVLGAFDLMNDRFLAPFWLVLGCVWVAQALHRRRHGVDLTSESAIVRRFRRRDVPWHEVQAVVRGGRDGSRFVRLIPESGEPVMLPAPTTGRRTGDAEYEQDFHRIGQWWLAHRGESWSPVRPEAPRPPVQG